MILQCACGRRTAKQPLKSSAVKPWLCFKCRELIEIHFVGRYRIKVHLNSPRGGMGRRKALKMSRL